MFWIWVRSHIVEFCNLLTKEKYKKLNWSSCYRLQMGYTDKTVLGFFCNMSFRRWLWFSPDHGNCPNVIARKGACMMCLQWLVLFMWPEILGWYSWPCYCLRSHEGSLGKLWCYAFCVGMWWGVVATIAPRRLSALNGLKSYWEQPINQLWALYTLGAYQRLKLHFYPPASSWAKETKLTTWMGNNAPQNIIICWNC